MTMGAENDYPVDDVARAWLIKMRGAEADMLRSEFEAWRAASPRNRKAYSRIADQLSASTILKRSPRYGVSRSRERLHGTSWLPWSTIAAAAAAVLLLAYGAGGAPLPGLLSNGATTARAAERLVTQRGEIRTFRLGDGSVATLDTDSRLDISFLDGKQHLRLMRGRVRLAAGGDRSDVRLRAGNGVIVARDADLDVSLGSDGLVRIALRRGAANFAAAGTGNRNSSALPIGRTLIFGETASTRMAARPAEAMANDWPSGWAEYRSISLGDLVAEANRYAARPILIEEPAVADLRLSGRFKISDAEAVASRAALLFGLKVTERQDGLHLRRQ